MYYPNQIVYDKDAKKPFKIGDDVWDKDSYPKRHIHFIKSVDHKFETALPVTIEEAEDLLAKGIIQPAPQSDTHCWKCGNWKNNCGAFKKCSEHEAWLSSTK